jgi:hypothetical protein
MSPASDATRRRTEDDDMTSDKHLGWSARGIGGLIAIAPLMLHAACGGAPASPDEVVARDTDELTSQLVWPVSATVTQNSAPPPGHPGIDLGAPVGTPVFAAASGNVVTPFWDPGGYGCNVVINHSGGDSLSSGIITVYGHLSNIVVSPDTSIAQGTLIGFSGGAAGAPCSGNSSGPHLHFEIRNNLSSVRGWDGSVHVGSWVNALDPIDTYIEGLPEGTADCEAACANFGCHCVDGQCSGGFCPGTGCTAEETAACGNYGVNCVDHQCAGGFGPGTGCTARETLDCGNYGANCVDHQCSGGFGAGTGCTARETLDCGNYGVNCVDHQCSGGFGPGSGCTAGETIACGNFGCGCVDHQCSGGFCAGTGCTAHETLECEKQGQSCAGHQCTK